MTTRDPRSRSPAPPDARDNVREPTQSLHELEPADADHPSLALGTYEKRTKIESPSAQRAPIPREVDESELRLGAQLGSYRVTELLGKGGMGYVYRAEHVKLGREVALKLLRGDYARRRDAVARFFQEARTVNRVRHRNIVDVTDFVELDDGTTFIIMELLQGVSLGKWARTGIDLTRALAILVQICDGLGAAHAVGVIHRDLKPDNVIVVPTSDGAELVKLLDFGVAKLLNRDDEDVGFQTAAGSVIGTPAYMSPEQAGGMAIDHRSDIYSLGAIMYELFCGQPMFRGRSFGEYVRKHLTEMPVPPRATPGGKDLDPRIEALILRCLEKEPALRFGHILELRDGLLHMLGGAPMSTGVGFSIAPLVATGTSYSVQVSPIPSMANISLTPPAPPTMAWWTWALGGLVAIGLGAGAAVWYARPSPSPSPVRAAVVMPTVPMPAPAPPPTSAPSAAKHVSVRFDSLPSAAVFADGHSAELCRTPCSFDVDLGDGGATDHRAFVVRLDGYQDKQVVVDLTTAHPEQHVTLERTHPAPAPAPVPVPLPVPSPSSSPPHPTPTPHPTPKPQKPADSIDQTETLDPFHTK